MVNAKGPIPLKYKTCTYCEMDFDSHVFSLIGRFPTRDHFIPISKGGSSRLSNLFVVCQHCNLIKGNMMPFEFIYSLSKAIEWKEFRFRTNRITYNIELMQTVLKNVKSIWNSDEFKNSKNAKTHIITTPKRRNYFYNERQDGEFHVVLKKEDVNTLLSQDDILRQKRIEYLQTQTIDQFIEKRDDKTRIKAFIKSWEAEPEPNFHEPI